MWGRNLDCFPPADRAARGGSPLHSDSRKRGRLGASREQGAGSGSVFILAILWYTSLGTGRPMKGHRKGMVASFEVLTPGNL